MRPRPSARRLLGPAEWHGQQARTQCLGSCTRPRSAPRPRRRRQSRQVGAPAPAPAAQSTQTGSAPGVGAAANGPDVHHRQPPSGHRRPAGRAGQRAAVPSTRPTAPLTSVSYSVVRAHLQKTLWALGPMGSGKNDKQLAQQRGPAPSPITSAATSVALLRLLSGPALCPMSRIRRPYGLWLEIGPGRRSCTRHQNGKGAGLGPSAHPVTRFYISCSARLLKYLLETAVPSARTRRTPCSISIGWPALSLAWRGRCADEQHVAQLEAGLGVLAAAFTNELCRSPSVHALEIRALGTVNLGVLHFLHR